MPDTINYTDARARLAEIMDQVAMNHAPVIITRRGHKNVVMLSAEEYSSLMETAHLLSSPKNAARLIGAIDEANRGGGRVVNDDELASRWSIVSRMRG